MPNRLFKRALGLPQIRLNLVHFITKFGFDASGVAVQLNLLPDKIGSENPDFTPEKVRVFERIILISLHRTMRLMSEAELKSFHKLVDIIQIKAKAYACDSVIKLLLCAALNRQHLDDLLNRKDSLLAATNGKMSENDFNALFGYILVLNFNQTPYLDCYRLGLGEKLYAPTSVDKFAICITTYATIDEEAQRNPEASIQRRNLLYLTGLFSNPLERDPAERASYNSQMLSSSRYKSWMLDKLDRPCRTRLIDVGAAGGALTQQFLDMDDDNAAYFGIELDAGEVARLRQLIEFRTKGTRKAHIIEGNAFELSALIQRLSKDYPLLPNEQLRIILSSVLHEIYSYCPNKLPASINLAPLQTEADEDGRYNPGTIAKVYTEALQALKDNPAGGCLYVRDGVMYKNPEESVTFVIHDPGWLKMLICFIKDGKYKTALSSISLNELEIAKPITMPAKYVQEFMLKATWGAPSFGNEINEVYCYLTLASHLSLIHHIAEKLGLAVDIEADELIQEGYQRRITEDKILIVNGFGEKRFPATNMRIIIQTRNEQASEAKFSPG